MLLSSLPDLDGSRCTLTYEPAGPWIRATWAGFVDNTEAMREATSYLTHLMRLPNSCLLNDNLALWGPWFDSADWLQHAWLPHAMRLGLRYVAHVIPANTRLDIVASAPPCHLPANLDLQIFHEIAEAEHWLRSCQRLPLPVLAPSAAPS